MGEVVDIEDYRPHLLVRHGKVVHVASLQLLHDFIDGKCDIERDLLVAITNDWLCRLAEECEE